MFHKLKHQNQTHTAYSILRTRFRVGAGNAKKVEMNEKRSSTANSSATKRSEISSGTTVDLSIFDQNVVLHVASFLSAIDLTQLGRTCGRFGVASDGRQRSLANEAAHQTFTSTATVDERNALPRYADESDTALLRQLYFLSERLEFRQLIGRKIYYTSDESKLKVSVRQDGCRVSALSNFVMRRGEHFATFNVSGEAAADFNIDIGIIRPLPGWDKQELAGFDPVYDDSSDDASQDLLAQRTDRWGTSVVNCCSYNCDNGYCYWSDWSGGYNYARWDGVEILYEAGTIGLLLDLNEGTLAVYKNGRRLGVMKSGLSGEYCWYASLGDNGDTVSIERGTLPERVQSSVDTIMK